MQVPQLSNGVLLRALAADSMAEPFIVQVLDVQALQPKEGNNQKRGKLVISDGVYKCIALLATQLTPLLESGQLQKYSILQINEVVGNRKLGNSSSAANKKLFIVLSLDVLGPGPYPQMIGNPQTPPDGPAGAPSAAAGNGIGNTGPYGGPPGPQAGGYGAPPPPMANGTGMYAAPPRAATGQYGGGPTADGMQQQPHAGGMYGGPGPNGLGTAPFGNSANAGGPGSTGMYGGPPQAAAAGGPSSGMYGGAGPQYGMGAGPVTQTNEPLRIVPVKSLNPYLSRWTIKARCTQKGEVRRWSNPRSEGKLFSFDLVDKDGTEIRATAWNDQVDHFYDMVQVGHIFMISKASLKPRNAKFNNTPHEYEIYLERSSQLTPCEEDQETATIPHIMFSFKKLAELETIEAGQVVDVIGVVDSVDPWNIITRRDGTETRKRSMVLRDDSGRSVEVTLWDKFTSMPGDELEGKVREGQRPVVAFKGLRVGDFNGKNLSSLSSTTVQVDPDRPEAGYLRNWYDVQGGSSMAVAALSEKGGGGGGRQDRRITLKQIKDEGLATDGNTAWVSVLGTIAHIRTENMVYPACTRDFNGRPCHKKLGGQEGSWWCERCGAGVDEPAWRYLLSVQAEDHTDHTWLTAFGEAGETIMGCTAQQFSQPENMDSAAFASIVSERSFVPYNLKLKIHQDSYGDEQKVKVSISKIAPVDFVAEGRSLLELINKLEAGQPIFASPGAAGSSNTAAGFSSRGATQVPYGGGAQGMVSPYGGGGGGYGGPTQYAGKNYYWCLLVRQGFLLKLRILFGQQF
eukprot:GHRR01026883.1.p1 GENE.GHRR01026883.1~~GHRR01026883.1.p1  ORF type:complete len:797 (+),score=258.36 GHRR01026883.1:172-2562(+)